jgi:small subunit ribosomal protein S9
LTQETEQQQYYYGTGKRKTAIAKVKLYRNVAPGEAGLPGQIQVNGKPLAEYFPWLTWQATVRQPLRIADSLDDFSVVAQVQGSGISSQSEAVRHGISKALVAYDESLKTPLRKQGLLTRDARIKESKKYGLKRARRAPQYTKR